MQISCLSLVAACPVVVVILLCHVQFLLRLFTSYYVVMSSSYTMSYISGLVPLHLSSSVMSCSCLVYSLSYILFFSRSILCYLTLRSFLFFLALFLSHVMSRHVYALYFSRLVLISCPGLPCLADVTLSNVMNLVMCHVIIHARAHLAKISITSRYVNGHDL